MSTWLIIALIVVAVIAALALVNYLERDKKDPDDTASVGESEPAPRLSSLGPERDRKGGGISGSTREKRVNERGDTPLPAPDAVWVPLAVADSNVYVHDHSVDERSYRESERIDDWDGDGISDAYDRDPVTSDTSPPASHTSPTPDYGSGGGSSSSDSGSSSSGSSDSSSGGGGGSGD
jgi:uncharacterized membrane protein YgcG